MALDISPESRTTQNQEERPDFDTIITRPSQKRSLPWLGYSILIFILALAAYLRFTGLNWGEYTYMHPDERFLVMVAANISPVQNLGEYFDTAVSSLNPHNKGYTFYVYGTFPLFLARYAAEWFFGQGGLQEVLDVGRPLSAFFDLLTLLILYLAGAKAFGRRVGLLAAAFFAVAVLPIQLSHYYKEDTFVNFFTLLTVYFALGVLLDKVDERHLENAENNLLSHWGWFIGFGAALGLAMACKLNAGPVAFLLPLAVGLRLGRLDVREARSVWLRAVIYIAIAALVSLVVFRIFQPYAFNGPGFLNVQLNPKWVDNIREQRAQADGDVDFPPAMQWARRPIWFSGENMIVWGLGLPLGLLAVAGFVYTAVRLLRYRNKNSEISNAEKEYDSPSANLAFTWKQDLLLFLWTAFYFTWQSLSFNPTMRYQLPIYPLLVLFAALIVIRTWDWAVRINRRSILIVTTAVSSLIFLLTAAYAFGFLKIYTRPFTRVEASRWIYQNIPGPINLHIGTGDGLYNQPLPFPYGGSLFSGMPYITSFSAHVDGDLNSVSINVSKGNDEQANEKTLTVSIAPGEDVNKTIASGVIQSDFRENQGDGIAEYAVDLDNRVVLEKGKNYHITLNFEGGEDTLALTGAPIANEGDWDDGLPLRVDEYDGFGGIYPGDLTFQMYWDDNDDKRMRFIDVLHRTQYLLITSNRQWGSLTRLPERFPLVTVYYRNLLGCPPERTVEWCYRVAQPGMFRGNLGFELVKVFQSNPSIDGLSVNTQFAEEAFTVYDHPKVFIFKKTADFDLDRVVEIFDAIDLERVIHVTPKRAASRPMDLMLPADRLAEQRSGGTWRDYFDPASWQNRYQILGVTLWYLFITLLGLFTYPLTRLAFSGLADKGYPLNRMAGLVILAYMVWFGGSYRIPFGRWTIAGVILLIVLAGIGLGYYQRDELKREWKEKRKAILLVEGVALAAFLLVLFIRLGNPDLWHPWKGGEKPMDFSYFNAVIKSTSFPPYDPWFAGGYLNYYYYGFVIFAVVTKFLGIVPAFAYNLILATIFSLIVLGAFCIGWNVRRHTRWITAGAAALGVALMGNLGTWRMFWRGFQMLVAPNGDIESLPNSLTSTFIRWGWALRGMVQALAGEHLPYGIADWYWNPSRAIAALGDVEPITEFPFFTILYADPHAHLYAIPIALLALAWAINTVIGQGWMMENEDGSRRFSLLRAFASVFVGALAIGALRPTNTWDFPTYLVLGLLAAIYALWKCVKNHDLVFPPDNSNTIRSWLPFCMPILLAVFAFLCYQPFAQWFGQAYTSIDIWKGPRTPLADYFTHWGIFLFMIVVWLVLESIDWMASTPLSSLRKLAPYRRWIMTYLLVLGLLTFLLGVKGNGMAFLEKLPFDAGWLIFAGAGIAWLVVPLAGWVGVLLLRPGTPDIKRAVLFLIGTGLFLTMFVEVFTLHGDVGRMNTVFKFYLQTWVFFAVGAAAGLGWTLDYIRSRYDVAYRHGLNWVPFWQLGVVLLTAAGLLYPITAVPAKVKDRMAPDAPHTLDGMEYMQYASSSDQGVELYGSEDYAAIRWMQENVDGSPVIVEANTPEYRWGSRYTIYTGLPGVVGWNWHQRQQRGFVSNEWVTDRVDEIGMFYNTVVADMAVEFLKMYDVRYIIVGQLERAYYPGDGLKKFEEWDGVLWKEVFRQGDTIIYQVTLD